MARIHTNRKGKSCSTKPARDDVPPWVAYSKKEVEELIVKLSKDGHNPSMIGLILRDQYGIPDVRPILGSKITKTLIDKGLGPKLPEDIQNLLNKAVALASHMEKHKSDVHNKRSLQLVESKIRRLAKHYKRSGKIPQDWRYDPQTAKLLVTK